MNQRKQSNYKFNKSFTLGLMSLLNQDTVLKVLFSKDTYETGSNQNIVR